MENSTASDWCRRFGLAYAPLFEDGEAASADSHGVLLNGGVGSFILSEVDDRLPGLEIASWAWSSSLLSHVTLRPDEVVVTSWDNPSSAEVFTRTSVDQRLEKFYDFLSTPRPTRKRDVIATMLDLFRSVRGELESHKIPDADAIRAFLNVFAELVSEEKQAAGAGTDFLDTWLLEDEPVLPVPSRERLRAGFRNQIESLSKLKLFAGLSVRHAASAIFQEAHFTFNSASQIDLFGYQPENVASKLTRGSHHFTPPTLARALVEQALRALSDIDTRDSLSICDPACGSGAFLTESLRTLRRLGFKGQLKLIGRDLSPPAIQMAKFALHAALFDWRPEGGVEIDLAIADALGDGVIPPVDVVAMNPPFIAWPMMSSVQRERTNSILKGAKSARPDFAMAFVTHALGQLNPGGVLASLLPASVLIMESAKEWRSETASGRNVSFIGSFGEYGLFAQAMVQVAAVVVVNGPINAQSVYLRSGNDARATSEALRTLRKIQSDAVLSATGDNWQISPVASESLASMSKWKFLPPDLEENLRRTENAGMPVVDDIFTVRQGLLTGKNDVFILSDIDLASLPPKERAYFKPAIFRDAILKGEIREKYFVFFPYNRNGMLFRSEDDLRSAAQNYYDRYLFPNKDELAKRSGVDGIKTPWWGLSRYYAWVHNNEPRILSKYFGARGDFALDKDHSVIPLHGYAWFLKNQKSTEIIEEAKLLLTKAYSTLLNTRVFERLLVIYSEPVAGGQANLSGRFVKRVPIPDLRSVQQPHDISLLAELSESRTKLSPAWLDEADRIASKLWGPELSQALLETDYA